VPVRGFECHRREISGSRLWGWARDAFGTPERFFERFFVANYCPLVFLEASGRNRTPDKLPACERAPLLAACDQALRQTIEVLRPRFVLGVGGFATARAQRVMAAQGADAVAGPAGVRRGNGMAKLRRDACATEPGGLAQPGGVIVGEILHPSPASPAANRGWRQTAVAQMRALGIELPAKCVITGTP
jgi:single-strand selective monofunctional uracil DNA glycosylase